MSKLSKLIILFWLVSLPAIPLLWVYLQIRADSFQTLMATLAYMFWAVAGLYVIAVYLSEKSLKRA